MAAIAGGVILAIATVAALMRLGWVPSRAPLHTAGVAVLAAAVGGGVVLTSRTARPWADVLRLIGLIAVALMVAAPYLTPRLVGGQDARWYAFTLADYVEQARAGVFPVWIGQGTFQFNGAVHPFRFAPLYLQLGGWVDLATARLLGVAALQHATVLLAAFVGVLGMYGSLSRWAPDRPWTAWLVATAYALSPFVSALLGTHDMYMSFVASAWVPWALGLSLEAGRTGHRLPAAFAGAALALTFAAHPPVGLWATGAAVVLLGVPLLCARRWGQAATTVGVACGTLVLLHLHTFFAIGELSPVAASEGYRGWPALAGALAVGLTVGVAFLRRRERFESDVTLRTVDAVLVAGAVSLLVLPLLQVLTHPGPAASAVVDTLGFSEKLVSSLVRRVSDSGAELTDAQPGALLMVLGGVSLLLLTHVRDVSAKLAIGLSIVLFLLLYPVTPLAKALWTALPPTVIAATSGVVNFRIGPVWLAVLSFGAFGAMGALTRWPWLRRVTLGLTVLGLVHSARELVKVQRLPRALTYSEEQTALYLRPENAPLYIYSGNFIGVPETFSHGVRYWRAESRLLDPATGQIVSAALRSGSEPIRVTLRPAESQPEAGWLFLEPSVTLPAGDWVRLTFDFAVPPVDGMLTLEGTHFYREYALPASGHAAAFGMKEGNGRSLDLWSTATEDQQVHLRLRAPAVLGAIDPALGFATLEVRPRGGVQETLRVVQLVPQYEALVDVDRALLLETPRTAIPGYVAKVNGRPVEVSKSGDGQVTVPLQAGHNHVQLEFVGSTGLRLTFVVSLAAWAALFAFGAIHLYRGRPVGN